MDGADGLLVEYACDGGDYQVFDLRNSGEMRNELECVTAQSNKSGSRVFLRNATANTAPGNGSAEG